MLKILVLCTGNSCRSIMAEGLLNHYGRGRLEAKSAGSFPIGFVHEMALYTLEANGISTEGYHSKSWEFYEHANFDVLITVCDRAHGETCPVYLGKALKTHWGVRDPAHFEGSEAEIAQEFAEVFKILELRVKALMALDFEKLEKGELKTYLDAIGRN